MEPPIFQNPYIYPNPQNLIEDEDRFIEKKNIKMRNWYCLFHIPLALLMIVMFILIIIILSFISNSEAYYFNSISTNWNLAPIDSFTLENCSANITNNILQDEWQGLRNGCNCFTYVRRGGCPKRSLCRNIAEKSSIPFVYWRGNPICSQRSNFKNYLFLRIEASAAEWHQELRDY